MQSIVSLMSVNNNSDIAPLEELEDILPDFDNYDMSQISEHVVDFTAQLEQLTNSLTNPELSTPMSGML